MTFALTLRYSRRPGLWLTVLGFSCLGLMIAGSAGGSESDDDFLPDCSAMGDLETYPGYESCPASMRLVIDDRFDSLDSETWERSTGGFPDNECRFVDSPDHVRFDGDGKMRLVMEKKTIPASYSRFELKMVDEKDCASGELRSIRQYGPYGRLEVRMKSPDSSGFVQSMFTFQFYKDPWQEIDIELQGRLPDAVSTNLISTHAEHYTDCDVYKCTTNTEKHLPIDGRHSSVWHVYAIDWRPDRVHFYVDGQLKRMITKEEISDAGGNYPDQAATLLMNFWQPAQKIAKWFGGEWSYDQMPLVAEYDWFRFYQYENGVTVETSLND